MCGVCNLTDRSSVDEFGISYSKAATGAAIDSSEPVSIAHEEAATAVAADITVATTATITTAAVAVVDDEDDEFGLAEDVGQSTSGAAADAIRRALADVAQRELLESVSDPLPEVTAPTMSFFADNSEFVSAAPSTGGAIYQPVEEPILAGGGGCPAASQANGSGVLAAARKALQEVVEVYGGGMGDTEVRMLDDSGVAAAAGDKSVAKALDKSVAGNVIEEGDEEAAEEVLPAAGLVTASADYYPTVAINALMRTLKSWLLRPKKKPGLLPLWHVSSMAAVPA